MVDISSQIKEAKEQWDTFIGNKREQGNSMVTNTPSLLSSDYSWLKDGELSAKITEQEWVEAITSYVVAALKRPADLTSEVEAINAGLEDLGLNAISNVDDIDDELISDLAWLKDSVVAKAKILGSKYKIDYQVETTTTPVDKPSEIDGNTEAENSGTSTSSATAYTESKVSLTIRNADNKIVYRNEHANATSTISAEGSEEKQAEDEIIEDIGAQEFGTMLNKFHESAKIDVSSIAKIMNNRVDALKEFKRVTKIAEELKAEFKAFNDDLKDAGPADLKILGYSDQDTETAAPTNDYTQEQQTRYNILFKRQTIRSELFANLSVENVQKLVNLARESLVSDISTLNESFNTVRTEQETEQKLEAKLDKITEEIGERIDAYNAEPTTDETAPATDASAAQGEQTATPAPTAKDEKVKSDAVKALNDQIDLVNKAKEIKVAFSEFTNLVDEIDEYNQFITQMRDPATSTATWIKSLFDSRRAITKPMIALALAAVTAGAAAAITAASAVIYSVSVALTAYASGRFASIYSMSKRHDVRMTDLHSNAMHYTSRVEVAATLLPVITSIIAPVALASNIAAQVVSYCGTVAMRAVYSVAASLTVNTLEVSRDTANSPTPVDQNAFAARARATAMSTELVPAAVLKKVNATIKGSKIEIAEAPIAEPTEEGVEAKPKELPADVISMNEIAKKANEGKLESGDISALKGLLKIDVKKDPELAAIAKLPKLLKALQSTYTLAKSQQAAYTAREKADANFSDERISFANNMAVPTN